MFCCAHFWLTAPNFVFFTSMHVPVPAALQAVDFSRDILSLMHGELHIAAYPFHGYWEDVGSLKDYYAANMAMASDVSVYKWAKQGLWAWCVCVVSGGSLFPSSYIQRSLHAAACAAAAAVVAAAGLLALCLLCFNSASSLMLRPLHAFPVALICFDAANVAAVQSSKLQLFDPETPIYSEARVLPPSKLADQVIMTGAGLRVYGGGVMECGRGAAAEEGCTLMCTCCPGPSWQTKS